MQNDDRHEWARVHDLRPGAIVTLGDGVSCVLMDRPVTLDDDDGWGLSAAIIGPPTHPKIGHGITLRFDDRVKPRSLPTEIREALHIIPRAPIKDDLVPRTEREQQRCFDDHTTLWALLNNVRGSIGTKEALPVTFSRGAHEALARVLEQAQAITQQSIEIHDVLTAAGIPDAKTLHERVDALLEKRKAEAEVHMQLEAKCASLDANLTAAREENRILSEVLCDIDTRLSEAFHKAARQTSVSILDSDLTAAQKACPTSTGLLEAHAQRYAAIRELSGMALAERHLRNELQVANEEVAGLRKQLGTLNALPETLRLMTTERDKFANDLVAIRCLLSKDGFNSDSIPSMVEVALEGLREAQKERDETGAELDAVTRDRAAAIALLESNGFAEFGSILNGVQLVLDTLRATQTERDVKAGQYREAHGQLVSACGEIEKINAQTNELAATMQKQGEQICGRTFVVDSHGRRMDVLTRIADAAKTFAQRADAYAKDLGQHRLKVAAMAKLLDGKPSDYGDDDPDISRLADLASQHDELRAERDTLRAAILCIQDALGAMPLDPTRPPNSGSKTDTIKAVAAVVAECKRLASKVVSVQAALQIANTQLQVANSNLMAALRLQQGDAFGEIRGPLHFVRALVELIAFWRRGAEPFQRAATDLETALKAEFGEAYSKIVTVAQGTNEIGAIIDPNGKACS